MAQVNLGRIGFVNKGSWNVAVNYKLNDVVRYGGSTYAAKRPNVGVTPPTNGTDTDDWFYFVNNSDYVDKTSNQDIPGIKNFTNGIVSSEISTDSITATEINGNTTVNDEMTFVASPKVPKPEDSNDAVNKAYVDDKTIINNFTNKPTPDNTDNFVLQEVGGNLRKVSYENLIKLNTNDSAIYATREYVNNLDNGNVKTTGNQTIAGIKTFNSSPIVPTPTAVNQAVNKQYVDNMVNSYAVAMAIVFGS